MKSNMSGADRVIRAIIAVVFGILYFTGIIPGTLGLILLIIAVIFLLTSFISFCPIYALLGMSTKKDKSPKA